MKYPSYIAFLLLGVLVSFALGAQTLIPTTQSAFDKLLAFNAAFIKSNNVKTITFDIIDKKDFQVAEDKNLVQYYEFDKEGRLKRFYYTIINKVIEKEYHSGPVYRKHRKISNGYNYTRNEYQYDTVSTVYFYNAGGDLALKRYNDGTYYESYYYEYDAQHRVTHEKRCKETNVAANKNDFQLGSQTIISDETYQYQETGKTQYKQVCQNNEGRTYKEIIVNFDADKRVINTNEQYTVAWLLQQTNFVYNKVGQMTEAVFKGNANGDLLLKRTYEYDSNGCIYSEKQYRNEVLQKEISYVSDAAKKINSVIVRDPNEKTIRIIKLLYAFY